VFCAFVYLIFPGFAKPVNPYWFDSPMALFELALSFWLLFRGLRAPLAADSTEPLRI
jgi:4-amino-4-deoxy-L-arabinose transferase-like glycosyltransferase